MFTDITAGRYVAAVPLLSAAEVDAPEMGSLTDGLALLALAYIEVCVPHPIDR